MAPTSAVVLVFSLVLYASLEGLTPVLARGGDSRVIAVSAHTATPSHSLSPRFLSYTMDHGYMTGAVNFSDPVILFLAQQLGPSVLRVGGTDSDFVLYDMPSRTQSTAIARPVAERTAVGAAPPPRYSLNATVWRALTQFAAAANAELVFGLNALAGVRNADGSWNGSNTEALLRFAESQGSAVYGLELGNEPDLYTEHQNYTVTPQQMAEDVNALRAIVDATLGKGVLLIGPDVSHPTGSSQTWLKDFTTGTMGTIDAVTWHFYYGNGHTSTANDTRSIAVMDRLLSSMDAAEAATASAPASVPRWLGETASFYDGGIPHASNRYTTGFLWLDKLGQAAARGYDVVARQSFNGGNYALVDPTTSVPNPDWWSAVLHKRLVGGRVISVDNSTRPGRPVRVYAHCATASAVAATNATGAVVLILVNPTADDAQLDLVGDLAGAATPRHEYFLTPGDPSGLGLLSHNVSLNGQQPPLALLEHPGATPPVALPPLPPRVVNGAQGGSSDSEPVVVPALTYGFVVLLNANAPACAQ